MTTDSRSAGAPDTTVTFINVFETSAEHLDAFVARGEVPRRAPDGRPGRGAAPPLGRRRARRGGRGTEETGTVPP
ncbi:hypothetical protein [Streptomyces radiopugnans]|uniref:Uncharacterized protein n=1 Tax=Streptomyces radiopugnans TaxID=403935 RepID=A0A1H8Z8X9_9ACTN|nr:hypothetical protein [Streptomyces radiopugnans]SEP60919.1 hypothetical protein SAMN05216481_101389 [Streptomyces radiopugnans]